MNSFTRLTQSLGKAVSGFWQRWGGEGYGRLRLLLPGTALDYEREAGDPWDNSIVALGLRWLGDRVSRPYLRVARLGPNGEHVPLPRHDLIDLWERPNPFYTRRVLEEALVLSLVCTGNGYVQKVRSRSGQVVQLWWLPHETTFPVWPSDGSVYLTGYRIWIDGDERILPASDVIHIRRGLDPRNDRLGLAAMRAQGREIVTVNEASTHNAAVVKNSGVPGLMIVPDDDKLRPTEADATKIKNRIRDAFTGDNRGEAIVLGGPYKVVPVGFSPEQLQLDKLPQAAVARLAASVGTAAMSLNLPDPGKTYSNLAEANRASWATIQALHDVMAEALRWQLLEEFGTDPARHVVEHDYSQIAELQEDQQLRSSRVRGEWTDGLRTLNEAREELGLAVVPDGDVFKTTTTTTPASPATPGALPAPEASDPGDAVKLAVEVLADVRRQLADKEHDHAWY